MKKICIFIVLSCFYFCCTRPESAKELLQKEGYTDIEITGYAWFACAESDKIQTGFKANKNGNIIEGSVCEGWFFKNKTIRYK